MGAFREICKSFAIASLLLLGAVWLLFIGRHPDELIKMPSNTDSRSEPWQATVFELQGSADGQTVLSRSGGNVACGSPLVLHRMGDDSPPQPLPVQEQSVRCAVLLPDASAAIVYGDSETVYRLDRKSSARTMLVAQVPPTGITALAISADGGTLAIAFRGEVLLCDPASGREKQRLPGFGSAVIDMVFSPDGVRLVTACGDGSMRVCHTGTGTIERELEAHAGLISKVRFLGRAGRVASIGLVDCRLCVWNLLNGELDWEVTAEQAGLSALAVSTDGALAATGGADQCIVLWDVRKRRRIDVLAGHTGNIRGLQFSLDGTTLVSAATDGTVRFWSVGAADPFAVVDLATYRPPSSK